MHRPWASQLGQILTVSEANSSDLVVVGFVLMAVDVYVQYFLVDLSTHTRTHSHSHAHTHTHTRTFPNYFQTILKLLPNFVQTTSNDCQSTSKTFPNYFQTTGVAMYER